MQSDEQNNNREGAPAAGTGNASNPSPLVNDMQPSAGNQLLDEKAEKYLREVSSIEDVPDPQDQQEADDTLREEEDKEQG